MSENFGHPVSHEQKLQISLLILITDFCPPPLHWGQNFLSSLQSVASLGCFENTDFTQLGFIVKLESKGDVIKKKKPAEHTLGCAERRQLIGRLSSAFNMCVHVWRKQTLRKQDRRDGKLV